MMGLARFLLLIILLAGFVIFLKFPGAFFKVLSSEKPPETGLAAFEEKNCNKDLWKHVYNPSRLTILDNCISVTGNVERIEQESDGDIHILLRVDQKYSSLPNSSNKLLMANDLVVEIICYGEIKEDAKEACRGYKNTIKKPGEGSHVKVVGSLVIDESYDWTEIHPVSKIAKIK